jgi:hypothetical protein
MNTHQRDLEHLAAYGANLVVDTSFEPESVDTNVLLESMVHVLEQPNARLVGAVIQAMWNALSELSVHETVGLGLDVEALPREGLLRLGYMSQRLVHEHAGEGPSAQLLSLSDRLSDALGLDEAPRPHPSLLALAGKMRHSDRARPLDELSAYWGVTSRPNLWEHYVHELPPTPGHRTSRWIPRNP